MPVSTSTVTVHPDFQIAPVNRRTFGSFVEHLGRCVYTGIHDPGHPSADADGFREDVLAATRELGVTAVRYPGGNFVSGYRWEDGVGPLEDRPSRLDLAWHSLEPNTVGLNEFIRWARKAEIEPMMAINLGTRGIQEAVDLLEYCNVESGSHWSDLRRTHGVGAPHDIRMWCLGNEMDGPWQVGFKTADEYGRLAAQTAQAMRMIDPTLELVACGSSSSAMPTFGAWERAVLTEAYEHVDLVSAHAYYYEDEGDLASFLGSAIDMDHFIDSVVATADHVRAVRKLTKRINISFDEWNVWYQRRAESVPPSDTWPIAPVLLEDHYNVADAVVVGNLLISLLRHSDRVTAASLAQLVNVIAPIMTEPEGRLWRQTTFHPFALTARHARGTVLHTVVASPLHETTRFGDTPQVDAVTTFDEETGAYCVLAVNRSVTDATRLEVRIPTTTPLRVIECVTLANPDDVYAQSTADDDTSLAPRPNATASTTDAIGVELPPVSWTMLRLGPVE